MEIESSDLSLLKIQPSLTERFQIKSILGRGSGSIIFKALDRQHNNRQVALKVLIDENACDEHTLRRFKEELRICCELSHPNLVKAYEFIEGNRIDAFTMEFIDGENLATFLTKAKPSPEVVEQLIDQLLAAVEELHRHGVLHRDIKPENIMICSDGVIKLTDLGLVKSSRLFGLTQAHLRLGTAQYMPPEYVSSNIYDQRGDIYAIGCVFYELLTGHRRYPAKCADEVLHHLIRTNFTASRLPLEGVPNRLITITEKAMNVDTEARFQSATEMRTYLRESKNFKSEEFSGRRDHLDRSVGVSLALLLVAVTGIFQVVEQPPPVEHKPPAGTYSGTRLDFGTSRETESEVTILKESDQTGILTSNKESCKEAIVDFNDRTFTCSESGVGGSFDIFEQGLAVSGAPYWVARFISSDGSASFLTRFERVDGE